MASMMQNPEFLRSMSDMMSRPEVVDQVGPSQLRGVIADEFIPWRLCTLLLTDLFLALSYPDILSPILSYRTTYLLSLDVIDHCVQSSARRHGTSNPTNDEQSHGPTDDEQSRHSSHGKQPLPFFRSITQIQR